MNKLRVFWGRIFYYTFQIFIGSGEYLIQRPLRFVFEKINTNQKKRAEINRATAKVLNDREFGFRIRFASIFMTHIMFFILSSIVLIFSYLFGFDIKSQRVDYFLYAIVGISYLIHYLAVIKNDYYITFFNQLSSLESNRNGILSYYFLSFHCYIDFCFFIETYFLINDFISLIAGVGYADDKEEKKITLVKSIKNASDFYRHFKKSDESFNTFEGLALTSCFIDNTHSDQDLLELISKIELLQKSNSHWNQSILEF
jgi:hypothetical protein